MIGHTKNDGYNIQPDVSCHALLASQGREGVDYHMAAINMRDYSIVVGFINYAR